MLDCEIEEPNLLNPTFSVVLPVYNRPEYLSRAIESVIDQSYRHWQLVIADDDSNGETKEILQTYKHCQIQVKTNPHNLGLFPNLNQAIKLCDNDYLVLLCSDDLLLPNCLEKLAQRICLYPHQELLLSAANAIDGDDNPIPSSYMYYYHGFMQQKPHQIFEPSESIPLLLKWGSINANLTGMCFNRSLFDQVGGFREDWQHAADFEWLYRACSKTSILTSTEAIASIREHSQQLSGVNYFNISSSIEAIKMVETLLHDPHLKNNPNADKWALHFMQIHLWYATKFALKGKWKEANQIVRAVNEVTGIAATTLQMLKWLPTRLEVYRKNIPFAMPPD
jgi:glycosyltransferase involved in cell wall biosynthesis